MTHKSTNGRKRRRPLDREADALFESLKPVVSGIQKTFGRMCEVVLHDYRQQEHSAVAVAGDVTHRQVGSPMSDIGLSLLRQGDDAEDKLNYTVRLADGKVMKSSTMLLRTQSGHVVGALCVNLDVTELRMFGQLLTEITGDEDTAEPAPTAFGADIDTVIDTVLAEVERRLGRPLTRLTTAEWTTVFGMLDERGMFQIRRAVPLIASRLGLSRASVYNYISRVRAEDDATK